MRKRVLLAMRPRFRCRCWGRPANKPVTVLALPGRRPKHQTGQGATLAVPDDVLQVLAHRAAKTQIMKLAQRRPHPSALGGLRTDLADGQRP